MPLNHLRVANQQVPAIGQLVAELFHDALFGLVVEVNQDIAQDDDIEVARTGCCAVQQVDVAKLDPSCQFGLDPDVALVFILALLAVFFPEMDRCLLRPCQGIDGALCKAGDTGIDVGSNICIDPRLYIEFVRIKAHSQVNLFRLNLQISVHPN